MSLPSARLAGPQLARNPAAGQRGRAAGMGESAGPLLTAALQCLRRRDLDGCCRHLERAIEVAPADPGLPALLGGVWLRCGDYRQARARLEASLQGSADQPVVLAQLATACLRLSDFAASGQAIQRALTLAPHAPEVLQAAAEYSLATQLHHDAVAACETLVRITPENAGAHLLLGQARLGLNDRMRAREALQNALRLQPDLRPAREALAATAGLDEPMPEPVPSEFARLRALAAASCPSIRRRLAWMEFRKLFNELIHGPIWQAHPAALQAWRELRISGARFGPLQALLAGGPEVHLRAPDQTCSMPEAFAALERWHDFILSAGAGAPAVTFRSWGNRRVERAPLPVGYARGREVEALCRELAAAPPAIRATLLHGSLADGRVAGGFSDADVLCLVERPRFGAQVFWSAAQWLFQLNHQLYAINPCMHHGPMIAFAAELEGASEAAVPSAIVRHGVWCKGGFDGAAYHDGVVENVLMAEMFEDYLLRHHLFVADLASAFDALWWTSSILLLPLLLRQAETGESVYKRVCYEERRAGLTPEQWRMLDRVSGIRDALGDWMAARLPEPGEPDRAANPGRRIALHRVMLAMTPAEIRSLGLDDSLMAGARALWCEIRGRLLAGGFRYFDQSGPAESPPRIWLRPLEPLPQPRPRVDYADARRLFLERCQSEPGVIAVHEFGEVGCPGLSDLDFLVVLADDCQGVPAALRVGAFPSQVAELMGHDPLFVSAAMAAELGAYFPIFESRQIWGAPLAVPSSRQFPAWVQAAAITHKNLRKYPEDLDGLIRRPVLDGRTVLAFLHSANHVRRCLEQLGCPIDGAFAAATAMDADFRRRFAQGERLGRADVLRAVEACLACTGPLQRTLGDYWRQAAAHLPANAVAVMPAAADASRWLQGELGLNPGPWHRRNDAPTLLPLLVDYLAGKRRFCEFESARGRTPSVYIEGPPVGRLESGGARREAEDSRPAPAAGPRVLLLAKTDALGDQILASGLVERLLREFPEHRIIWLVRMGIHRIIDLLDGATCWWANPHRAPSAEAQRWLGGLKGGSTNWGRVTVVPVPFEPGSRVEAAGGDATAWWAGFVQALGAEVAIAGSPTVSWVDQFLVAASGSLRRFGFAPVANWQRLPSVLLEKLPPAANRPFTVELAGDPSRDEIGNFEHLAAAICSHPVSLAPALAPRRAELSAEWRAELAECL